MTPSAKTKEFKNEPEARAFYSQFQTKEVTCYIMRDEDTGKWIVGWLEGLDYMPPNPTPSAGLLIPPSKVLPKFEAQA